MNRSIIIKNPGQEWRVFWLIGTSILLIGLFLNNSLYFVYLYIYIGAIVLLVYSKLKYAELNQYGIKLNVGLLLKRSSIHIKWETIDYIKIKYVKKKYRTAIQGTGQLGPTSDLEDDKVLEILVKNSFSSEDQRKILDTNKFMFKKRINIKGQDKILQLRESPGMGFDQFCKIAELYRTGGFDLIKHNGAPNSKYLLIADIILFLLPPIMFIVFKKNSDPLWTSIYK